METSRKNKLSWFIVCCVFCIPVLTSHAGIQGTLSELVKPGGVEIPVIVNVLGPEEPNDINDVKEMFRKANEILIQDNVQFDVKWINPGVTLVGNGDGKLSENEFNEVLHRSVFELSGLAFDEDDFNDIDAGSIWRNRFPRFSKGIKFNIADDVWVEQPDRVFWHDNFYPVVFLESSLPPEQLGHILVQNFGLTAGLSPSTDPTNFLHLGGQGTIINEDQKGWIPGLGRQIGYVRSPLAEGYSPDVLADLRHKWSWALFQSEGFVLRGDYREDVIIEDAGGSQIGSSGVDLEAFIAKSGLIGDSDLERELVLKYYFGVGQLPEDIYMDTYLRVHDYHNHGDNGNGGPVGLPWEIYDFVIGTGVTSSGLFVGVTNLLDDGEWNELSGIQPEVSHDLGRTKVRIGVPLSVLERYLPEGVREGLNDGRGLELRAFANTFTFDLQGGFRFEDDSIENTKFAAKPRLGPQITAAYSFDDIDPATLSAGIDVRMWILEADPNSEEDPNDPNGFEALQAISQEILRNKFDQPIAGVEAGRAVLPWINFNTNANNDSFNSGNGFQNDPYPGIDLSSGTNVLFATEASALVDLTAGLYITGLEGKDNAAVQIGPVKIGDLFQYNYDMKDDINNGSNGEPVNGSPSYKGGHDDDRMSVLRRGDSAFEVVDPGLFLLRLRAVSRIDATSSDEIQPLANGTSGASLELHQVLQDGRRVLLGDVANGALGVYIPPADIDVPDVPDEPDEPDVTNGLFEGFETGIIDRSRWSHGGDADWVVSTEQAHSGSYYAQSGSIGDDESSTLSFVEIYPAAGEISFWLKVSSEEGFDILSFSLNGEVLGEWSGERDWEQAVFPSRRGPNTFVWAYIKDISSDSGDDSACIDDILFPPTQ